MADNNFDYNSQANSLIRRQKLLQSLLERSQQPLEGQVAGGMVVPIGNASVMAKLLESKFANNQSGRLQEEERMLNQQQAEDTKRQMEQFYETSQGRDILPIGNIPGSRVPGNQRKAILDAMASNNPAIARMGQEEMAAERAGRLTPKDFAGMSTPTSVLESGGNVAGFVPRRTLTDTTPGSVQIDEAGNIATPGPLGGGAGSRNRIPDADFPGPLGGGAERLPSGEGFSIERIGGDLYQRTATGLKKLDNAQNINTTVNNATPYEPGKKFNEAVELAQAGQFSEAIATRNQMINASKAIKDARQLVDQEIFNGIAGNLAMNANRLDAALFGGDTEKVARTETFKADMGTVILPAMKQLGGNDSNEELVRMEKWMAGDITLTPEAIKATLDRFVEDLDRQASEIDIVANEVRQATGLPTLNLPRYGGQAVPGSPAPATAAPPAGTAPGDSPDNPIDLEEFLRQFSPGGINGQ